MFILTCSASFFLAARQFQSPGSETVAPVKHLTPEPQIIDLPGIYFETTSGAALSNGSSAT
ncbi:MAG: hypothetical protein IPO59_14950 [Betaproteobacteria bacterium]|nr:hypothetical protein [Betaproteobacteria bacterium]